MLSRRVPVINHFELGHVEWGDTPFSWDSAGLELVKRCFDSEKARSEQAFSDRNVPNEGNFYD